jgi:hypothetical protein
VKSIKASRTSVSRSATSIPALLLLGTLSGTALAATDIQEPCPEAAAQEDVLQAFIDAEAPLVRTVEASEPAAPTQSSDADSKSAHDSEEAVNAPASDSSTPAYTTRLPGVSVNDMPGFRRHMYRTDI